MEIIKVVQEKENPLFGRKEVSFIVESDSNPGIADAEKIVSEKFSSPIETIKIKSIKGKFGRRTFLISSNIYKSEEDKNKIEPKPKEKKK
jgi:ribosomal protein S24E